MKIPAAPACRQNQVLSTPGRLWSRSVPQRSPATSRHSRTTGTEELPLVLVTEDGLGSLAFAIR